MTEVDTDAELGLNKKDIMIEYTNLELLHAVLAKHDAVWPSVGALPRKTEGGAAVTDCDGGECARNTRRPAGKRRSRLCISTRRSAVQSVIISASSTRG